ncbi:MAG: Integrase family protein [Pedosphaera sp.]|nr:Integrase family protein [Pedosphaera sp.]
MKEGQQETKSNWQRTQFSNLIRYVPSGIYFARFKVRGKLIRQSLKTDQLTVAVIEQGKGAVGKLLTETSLASMSRPRPLPSLFGNDFWQPF